MYLVYKSSTCRKVRKHARRWGGKQRSDGAKGWETNQRRSKRKGDGEKKRHLIVADDTRVGEVVHSTQVPAHELRYCGQKVRQHRPKEKVR